MALSAQQIEDKLAEVEEFYQKVKTAEMPETLKDAIDEGWSQVIDVLEVEVGYSKAEREEDSRRIITFDQFKRTFDEWEEKMVEVQIKSPLDYVLGPIKAVEGIWNVIKELWNNWSIYGKIFSKDGIVKFIVEHLLEVIAVSASIAMFKALMAERDSLIGKLRKRALPRNDYAPRYQRRKLARL